MVTGIFTLKGFTHICEITCFLWLALIAMILTGCLKQESSKIESPQNQFTGNAEEDLIPWKPLTVKNLRKSAESGKWLLVDFEQLGIFQTQRGELDYRKSNQVSELLKTAKIDCYYVYGEGSSEAEVAEMREAMGVMRDLAKDLDDSADAFAYFYNFKASKGIPITKGTASELIEILKHISQTNSIGEER